MNISMYGMFRKEQLYSPKGVMFTKALFREHSNPEAPLTLSKHNIEGYENLRELFLSYCVNDPTELMFAEAVFGDWQYWDNLREISWMKREVVEWRKVCDTKRKALAFSIIIGEALSDKSRNRYNAAKYLIEEPWKMKGSVDKRKTRKEMSESASAAFEKKEFLEDLERVRSIN